MIVVYAQRRDWPLEDLRVDVDYSPDSKPGQVEVTIHLPDGLTPDQTERLQRVAGACPVKRALEAGFTFSQKVVLALPSASRL